MLWLPTISARAEMTFPSVVKDLLMFAPSWWREEKPRFQSGDKARCTRRMGMSQYWVGKEQLVLLGNQHLPAEWDSWTTMELALGSFQTKPHQGFWQCSGQGSGKGKKMSQLGTRGAGHGVPTSRRGPHASSHL